MSIRFQSGRVHSSPDLDAFSISFGRVAYRQAGLLSTKFNRFLHRLPGRKYASNSLSGHQLERSLGLFDLWKQVQKID
jgi:hypothetical protein